jgi:hypothetical protein
VPSSGIERIDSAFDEIVFSDLDFFFDIGNGSTTFFGDLAAR